MLNEDARALATLVNMHWTNGGWRDRNDPFDASPEDIAHAVTAGYLFPKRGARHDQLVEEVKLLAAALSLGDASRSFVASLSRRKLFLRPFLSSLVVARTLPAHEFASSRASGACAICGLREEVTIDCDVLSFERHKWGGVRLLDLRFVWFSLERLAAEGGAEPTVADYDLLDTLLAALRELPAGTSASAAEVALRCLKSNMAERHTVIQQLSICGVLADPAHPGFLFEFVPHDARTLPSRRFLDRGYPAEWWTADCGVNEEAVRVLLSEPHA